MGISGHLALLRDGGLQAWNAWRSRNPGIRPDLSGLDLGRLDLRGVDLTGADLRGTDLRDVRFDDSTDIDGITLNSDTKWPHGYTPAGRGMNHDVVATLPFGVATSAVATSAKGILSVGPAPVVRPTVAAPPAPATRPPESRVHRGITPPDDAHTI